MNEKEVEHSSESVLTTNQGVSEIQREEEDMSEKLKELDIEEIRKRL